MAQKKYGALSSSTDSQALSQTVTGLIISLSAGIIALGGLLNIPLTDSQVAVFSSQAGIGIGALWTLYGLLRKLVVYFSKTDPIPPESQ